MEKSSSKVSYDKWHSEHEVDAGANALWHRRIKSYAKPEHDFRGRRVLEIGCGRGGFACWLAAQPFKPSEIVAADFSSSAVDMAASYAAKNGIEGIKFIEADIQKIPFASNTFDTVISCETIEHVPDPKKAVRELLRVLRPGGRLYLTTPNYFGPFGIYRCYLRAVGRPYTEAGQPINKFVMLPLTLHWLKKAGLSVEVFGSDDIVIPRLGGLPWHLTLPSSLSCLGKWIGLQSYVFGTKQGATFSESTTI
jgi:2-polyprenyl-3-methyl-5-hydroxy-6-metoxy-1,4-benzoquinol methylase